MIVTLRATEREPEHRFAESPHAISAVNHEVFPINRAAFVRHHAVAFESCGGDCFVSLVWQQIACELLGKKAVVRFIGVERVDHIVAPEPRVTTTVNRKTIRVCIARGIKPRQRHAFTKLWTREKSINQLLIRKRIFAQCKRSRLLGGRRQTREIETYATNERGSCCVMRRTQRQARKPSAHKRIDRLR